MTRTAMLLLLVLVTAVSLGLAAALRPDRGRPNYEILPDMVQSPAYGSQSANAVLPAGQTAQTSPPGAIARGYAPLHYAATPEDAQRAGEELHAPLSLQDPALRARGAEVFANFCQMCHGADGSGMGPVAQRGFPPPPSLLTGASRTMKDGQIFHLISFGQGSMPAHAGQIDREDRWAAVAHVRRLQEQPPEVPPEVPAPEAPAAAQEVVP